MPSDWLVWPVSIPSCCTPSSIVVELPKPIVPLLRSRNALVECRTKLINHARGMVKSIGGRLPSCSTSSFHKRVRQDLPVELKPSLTPVLDTIAALTLKIQMARDSNRAPGLEALPGNRDSYARSRVSDR